MREEWGGLSTGRAQEMQKAEEEEITGITRAEVMGWTTRMKLVRKTKLGRKELK